MSVSSTTTIPAFDKKLVNYPLNYAAVGATGLFTTVEDEVGRLKNYYKSQRQFLTDTLRMTEKLIINIQSFIDLTTKEVVP
mgnify:CR=1 FL=1